MPAPLGNKYALGNLGGAPTKLTLELVEKAKQFVDWCEKNPIVSGKTKTVISDENGTTVSSEKEEHPRLPTIAGLARWLKIGRTTVYLYLDEAKEFLNMVYKDEPIVEDQEKAKMYREFVEAVENVQSANEEISWIHGMAGTFSPVMTKFALSAVHNYREKSEQDITSDGQPIIFGWGKPSNGQTDSDSVQP